MLFNFKQFADSLRLVLIIPWASGPHSPLLCPLLQHTPGRAPTHVFLRLQCQQNSKGQDKCHDHVVYHCEHPYLGFDLRSACNTATCLQAALRGSCAVAHNAIHILRSKPTTQQAHNAALLSGCGCMREDSALSHYEILGVPRTAATAAIKACSFSVQNTFVS